MGILNAKNPTCFAQCFTFLHHSLWLLVPIGISPEFYLNLSWYFPLLYKLGRRGGGVVRTGSSRKVCQVTLAKKYQGIYCLASELGLLFQAADCVGYLCPWVLERAAQVGEDIFLELIDQLLYHWPDTRKKINYLYIKKRKTHCHLVQVKYKTH